MNYQAEKDNLYQYKMLLRIKQNNSYKNIFRVDLTRPFLDDLKMIARSPKFTRNTIISISGETGSSKSISALTLGLDNFQNFSYKNMFFYDQQILNYAHKFPKNSFIIRDENPQKAVFGQGSVRTAGQFVVLSETCRKYGLNLCLIEPSFIQNPITKIYNIGFQN